MICHLGRIHHAMRYHMFLRPHIHRMERAVLGFPKWLKTILSRLGYLGGAAFCDLYKDRFLYVPDFDSRNQGRIFLDETDMETF